MEKKKNLVIFSGSIKPTFYEEIKNDLIKISKSINIDKYDLYYGGGE